MPAAAVVCRRLEGRHDKGECWDGTCTGVDPRLIEHANQYLADDNVLFLGGKRTWNQKQECCGCEGDPNDGWNSTCVAQVDETLLPHHHGLSNQDQMVHGGSNQHTWCSYDGMDGMEPTVLGACDCQREKETLVRPASAPNLQTWNEWTQGVSSDAGEKDRASSHAIAPRTPTAAEVSAAARAAAAVQELANKPNVAGHMTRRCVHCGATKTPQWRAGPAGQKTLCNACGVRYKAGRLLPQVNFPPTEDMCQGNKLATDGVAPKATNATKRRKV